MASLVLSKVHADHGTRKCFLQLSSSSQIRFEIITDRASITSCLPVYCCHRDAPSPDVFTAVKFYQYDNNINSAVIAAPITCTVAAELKRST